MAVKLHPGAGADSDTPVRSITALGFPFLLGAFSSSMSGVVDTAMMGRYSAAGLAAVSGASAIFDVFSAAVLASVTGHQILAARFAGRQDPAGIRRSLRSSAWFCGAIAVLLTVACLVAGGWLTGLVSGGHAGLRQIGAQYLIARGPTLLLLVPFSLLAATFNAYKRPRYAMFASLLVSLLNLLLDWLLIYGPGPLPRLGAAGNGLATTISWLIGIGCLLVATRRFRLLDLLRQPGLAEPADFTTSIPRLGWPAIVSMTLDYVSTAIFFGIVGGAGEAALGGGRIAFQVMVLAYGTGTAFSSAVRILIGRSAGAGRVGDFQAFWRASRLVLLPPAVLLASVLIAVPRPASLLFTSIPPVVDATAKAMPLIGLCLPLIAWTLGNVSVLRALGQTSADMYANLIAALGIQLPVSWLFVHVAHLGISGAFIGVAGYWLIRGAVTEVLAHTSIRRETQRVATTKPVQAPGLGQPGLAPET